jgi:hypothetical protein
MIPIGAIIAIMPHLTGAYNCTATTEADANGFVVCGGQAINDVTSPMHGQTIPNVNNDVFIAGHSTSGTVGGANAKDLSHTHTVGDHAAISAHSVTNNAVTSGAGGSHQHSVTISSTTYLPSHAHTINHGHTASSSSFFSVTGVAGEFGNPAGAYKTIDTTPTITVNSYSGDSGSTGSGTAFNTGTESSHTHSVTSNVAVGAHSAISAHSVGTSLSSTYDNRPSYITAKYIMRVK